MTATLTLVPLDKIKPGDGFNPRSEFAEEQMAELVASVKRHGIITPLTLAPAEWRPAARPRAARQPAAGCKDRYRESACSSSPSCGRL